MKTIKISFAAIMIAAMFTVSSCKKEDQTNPESNPAANESVGERRGSSMIFPVQANMFGQSYAEWSADWWKWSMEFSVAGHPFVDDPSFNVSTGQSGHVWFLATPFGTVVRNITIPHGTALFVGLLNAEASDLEGLGTTAIDQLANADFLADHIRHLTASIDGNAVTNITSYRFASAQFSFTAPTPWIFGETGGNGTSVGDGYFIMVKPLSTGTHTIHYTGDFHFAIAEGDPFDYDAALDMTYNITVH